MKETKKAFLWIVSVLEKNNIRFRISGGFAARIYGAKRKLADIDVEVFEKDINDIYRNVKSFIIYGPERYIDENWNLVLITLKYGDQEIDIAAIEAKIFNQKTKRWVKKPGNFKDSNLKNVFGIQVLVEKKEALIRYKKILNREVDIKDVAQLEKNIYLI